MNGKRVYYFWTSRESRHVNKESETLAAKKRYQRRPPPLPVTRFLHHPPSRKIESSRRYDSENSLASAPFPLGVMTHETIFVFCVRCVYLFSRRAFLIFRLSRRFAHWARFARSCAALVPTLMWMLQVFRIIARISVVASLVATLSPKGTREPADPCRCYDSQNSLASAPFPLGQHRATASNSEQNRTTFNQVFK